MQQGHYLAFGLLHFFLRNHLGRFLLSSKLHRTFRVIARKWLQCARTSRFPNPCHVILFQRLSSRGDKVQNGHILPEGFSYTSIFLTSFCASFSSPFFGSKHPSRDLIFSGQILAKEMSGVAPANQTKERSVHELFAGAFRNKSSMWIVLVFQRKKHQNSQKWAKFMNFSSWPFFWFGLLGWLLKMPKMITSHDVLEPLKQVLSASRDVIVPGQTCGSKLQRVFTLGDGCWLPIFAPSPRCTEPLVISSQGNLGRKRSSVLWETVLRYIHSIGREVFANESPKDYFLIASVWLSSDKLLGIIQRKQKGVENPGEGKIYHKTPSPKTVLDPPPMIRFPPPFVHSMSFCLEETDTNQTNPTFWGLQKVVLEGALYSTFCPQNRMIRFAPP